MNEPTTRFWMIAQAFSDIVLMYFQDYHVTEGGGGVIFSHLVSLYLFLMYSSKLQAVLMSN